MIFVYAGLALQELAKEKPQAKQIETHTTTFMKTLMEVEKKMTNHINYLTQVSTGMLVDIISYQNNGGWLLVHSDYKFGICCFSAKQAC